jgi:hypothetical protein
MSFSLHGIAECNPDSCCHIWIRRAAASVLDMRCAYMTAFLQSVREIAMAG